MKTSLFILGFLCAALAPLAAFAVEAKPQPSAAPVFSDKVCPNATLAVRDFDAQTANPNTTVDVAIATGERVIEVYRQCMQEKMATASGQSAAAALNPDSGIEGAHYAQVRQAQYYVVIGRLQRLIGNTNSARDDMEAALKLVADTIDWRASAQGVSVSNNVNRGGSSGRSSYGSDYSNYRQGALDIQKDAKAELALLK